MLGSGFSKQKLKVNLKLAINRLKLLEKKKSEFICFLILFLVISSLLFPLRALNETLFSSL